MGEGFVVIDLLGHPRTEPLSWMAAEEACEQLGVGYLAEPYELRLDDGSWLRVRITEVSPSGVRVKREDWGDITAAESSYSVPFPVSTAVLRPL